MTRKSKPPIAIYSALADATRCRIIDILLAGPIPVHTLADAFAISRPAISRHLRVLKTAGLVAEVKKGRENLYTLRTAKLAGAMAWIGSIATPSGPAAEVDAKDEAAALPEPMTNVPNETAAVASSPAVRPTRRRASPVAVAAPAKATSVSAVVTPTLAKPERPARPVKPEPAASQMGFDF